MKRDVLGARPGVRQAHGVMAVVILCKWIRLAPPGQALSSAEQSAQGCMKSVPGALWPLLSVRFYNATLLVFWPAFNLEFSRQIQTGKMIFGSWSIYKYPSSWNLKSI